MIVIICLLSLALQMSWVPAGGPAHTLDFLQWAYQLFSKIFKQGMGTQRSVFSPQDASACPDPAPAMLFVLNILSPPPPIICSVE